jgi:hypothetical protein
MTDYVSLLIIPVFWLVNLKDCKKLAISHIPMLVIFMIWLPVFQKQLLAGLSLKGSNWWGLLGSATFKNATLIPVKFILGRISFDDKLVYAAIVLVAISLYGFVLFRARKSSKLLWCWLVLPIILGILVSFKIPTLSYFRFIFCLPALYILVSKGFDLNFKSGKFLSRSVIFIVILLINLVTTGYYLFNPKFQREDWRGLVKFVESQKTTNSITIFVANSNMEAYLYYAPDAKIAGPGAIKPGYDQLWLMRYLKDVFDPEDQIRTKVEALGYKKAGDDTFNGVEVWKYTKK